MNTFEKDQRVRVTKEVLKAYEGESDGSLEPLVGKEGTVAFTIEGPSTLVSVKWDDVDQPDLLWDRELEAV